MSPTARTLKQLRDDGWLCQVVEHWNSFAKIRQDLFGFIDILAVREGQTLGIQVTTESNAAARRSKMLDTESHLRAFLRGGNLVQLWTWQKRKSRWRYRVRRFIENGSQMGMDEKGNNGMKSSDKCKKACPCGEKCTSQDATHPITVIDEGWNA